MKFRWNVILLISLLGILLSLATLHFVNADSHEHSLKEKAYDRMHHWMDKVNPKQQHEEQESNAFMDRLRRTVPFIGQPKKKEESMYERASHYGREASNKIRHAAQGTQQRLEEQSSHAKDHVDEAADSFKQKWTEPIKEYTEQVSERLRHLLSGLTEEELKEPSRMQQIRDAIERSTQRVKENAKDAYEKTGAATERYGKRIGKQLGLVEPQQSFFDKWRHGKEALMHQAEDMGFPSFHRKKDGHTSTAPGKLKHYYDMLTQKISDVGAGLAERAEELDRLEADTPLGSPKSAFFSQRQMDSKVKNLWHTRMQILESAFDEFKDEMHHTKIETAKDAKHHIRNAQDYVKHLEKELEKAKLKVAFYIQELEEVEGC